MKDESLRIAFLPDTYDEIDGVAHTARQYEQFALRREMPFLLVHGGTAKSARTVGTVDRLSYPRGRVGFRLDKKHDFDLLFWRHYQDVEDHVRRFQPDVLHITGPSDLGQIGALVAHRLRIPLAASWHTNVHEYAERRAECLVPFLPAGARARLGETIRHASLRATLRFYRIAQILFAPNPELIQLVESGTGKSCFPMLRGVDTLLFNPTRRTRSDEAFVVGYVGRLTTEKNIRLLVDLEKALMEKGPPNFRFLIVGQGAEEMWLKSHLQRADFPGVLRGEDLARAYANMDVFVFPSETDTYGNVVLEALASGVPAIVTDKGGPRFIITAGEDGFVAQDLPEFVTAINLLAANAGELARMRVRARARALKASWDSVFESVYSVYERGLRACAASGKSGKIVRPRRAQTMAVTEA